MADKDANIDLLFRNGLKDLEILPPVEAWNNILPIVRKKQRPVIILRSAALVAVILSMTFLAYRWSQEISRTFQAPILALGEESVRYQDPSADQLKPEIREVLNPVKERSGEMNRSDSNSGTGIAVNTAPDPGPAEEYNILAPESQIILPGSIMQIRDFRVESKPDLFQDRLDTYSYAVPKEKTDRWTIMAMASPTYYPAQIQGTNEISNQISSAEQSQISYSGGVSFAYRISKKLSIQSGLYYASVGHEVSGINSFGGFKPYDYTKGDHNFEVLTSNGLIYTSNADVFLLDNSGDRVLTRYTRDIFDPAKAKLSYINSSLYQNFSYLEMPVVLRYKFYDRNVDFDLIGGLSYNLLVNNSVHTSLDGSKYNVGKTAGLNPFLLSSSLGMGMEYNLSEKFSLNLEPTFRYYLNPFGMFPGLKSHPYSFGIFSGLSYKF